MLQNVLAAVVWFLLTLLVATGRRLAAPRLPGRESLQQELTEAEAITWKPMM